MYSLFDKAISNLIMVGLLIVSQSSLADSYSYTDIGLSDFYVFPVGINDSGQIVGYSSGDLSISYGRSWLYNGSSYTTLQVPNEPSAYVMGINNNGEVLGTYYDATGYHFYIYNAGNYSTFNGPNGNIDTAAHINDSGIIAGTYSNGSDTLSYGFIYANGSYTTLDDPNGLSGTTNVANINNNDVVVGTFKDAIGSHGFIENNGAFTTVDDPVASPGSTTLTDINASGEMVGTFNNASGEHGFIYQNGRFITLDDPDANPGTTSATLINLNGEVVGTFWNAGGLNYFVYNHGVYTTLNDPHSYYWGYYVGTGPGATYGYGINANGEVVGSYTVGHGFDNGYVAIPTTVPLPAASWQMGIALVSWLGLSQRKKHSLG